MHRPNPLESLLMLPISAIAVEFELVMIQLIPVNLAVVSI